METKFNFNSQVCTSRSQSERLLALGLKKETADMAYLWYGRAKDDTPLFLDKPSIVYQGIMTTHDLPAWSLHRLMLLATSNSKVMLIRYDFDIFDYLIRRIEYAIQEGYFNKEYLVNQDEIDEHCKGVMEYLDYIREED